MSLVIAGERPVHFPKDGDRFQFDSEVAEIFENMAERSIPMYSEFHRMHASMLESLIMSKVMNGGCTIMDIGASTGRWWRVLRAALKVPSLDLVPDLHCFAFDNSLPMIAKMRNEFPEVAVSFLDLTSPNIFSVQADIVVLFYVLQFIPDDKKLRALQWIAAHMKPGGVLLLGQKEDMGEDMDLFQEEYIRFRVANGYTREEIEAKTKALKNSMWCITPQELRGLLSRAGFRHVVETSRWLQFSTAMATL